ncbi:MAG TPA: MBL fold metallo-hydrolase [Burkholderiales bacterium]|nr:MBL fold metallo-hydrolase [Burkholderiales bacterium]
MFRVVTLALCLLAAAPAAAVSDPVKAAAEALGGAKALAGIRSLTVSGSVTHWEPEQSLVPGGEPRLAGESSFTQSRDLTTGASHTEWVRKLVYPAPREYKFTEVIAGGIGWVSGVDSTTRTKQSLDSNPPQHAMSGLRVAAALREMQRTSPRLVADLLADPRAVSRVPDEELNGKMLPTVSYRKGNYELEVLFDPATRLPAAVRSHDYDNNYGDSTYDLLLSDWRTVGGVKVAHALEYRLNDIVIARAKLDRVTLNPKLAADTFAIPDAIRASASKAATGYVPWQWVLRRQNIGVYLDSDKVAFDPAAPGLKFTEIAKGVSHVTGGTHNSLVVEMKDYLIVFDAPIGETQSRFTIAQANAKYPGKPIRYLVLTHHHMDHMGGAKTFVADGAAVIVGPGAGEHVTKLLRRPRGLDGEGGPVALPSVEVIEIAETKVLGDGSRSVGVYVVENPHAKGLVIGYIPDVRLGFVTDIFSPGRDKLGEKLTGGQAALVAAVKKYNLNPERFAGGHGTSMPYAELVALDGK